MICIKISRFRMGVQCPHRITTIDLIIPSSDDFIISYYDSLQWQLNIVFSFSDFSIFTEIRIL